MSLSTRLKAGAACLVLACAAGTLTASAQTQWKINNLVFTSFAGSGDGLHLSVSEDEGRTWKDQGKVFFKPTVGGKLMRDPHIMRGPDGVFHATEVLAKHDENYMPPEAAAAVDKAHSRAAMDKAARTVKQ